MGEGGRGGSERGRRRDHVQCTRYVYTEFVLYSTRFLASDISGLYMDREARVLGGLVNHVLPRVGGHVRTLDLAHGKAVSNEIVS